MKHAVARYPELRDFLEGGDVICDGEEGSLHTPGSIAQFVENQLEARVEEEQILEALIQEHAEHVADCSADSAVAVLKGSAAYTVCALLLLALNPLLRKPASLGQP